MAIGPFPAPMLPGALEAATAQMAGMTADQAYQEFMDEEYDVSGDVKIGYTNKTSDYTPAITGDTSGSVIDSTNPVPVDSWNEYVENEKPTVSDTTGGIVSGSNVNVLTYSILEATGGTPEAVSPYAVPLDAGIVAAAQAFGVSLDAANLDAEVKRKLATSAVATTGVIYDKAKNLVTVWRDSLGRILFPKAFLKSIYDTLKEEGIGESGGSISELDTSPYEQPIRWTSEATAQRYRYTTGGGWQLQSTQTYSGICIIFNYATTPHHNPTAGDFVSQHANIIVGNETGAPYYINGIEYIAGASTTIDGKSFGFTQSGIGSEGTSTVFTAISADVDPYTESGGNIANALWTAIFGTYVEGDFPEGSSRSEAPSYSIDELTERGSIKGADGASIPVVPINIPDDPYNSTGSTTDPQDPTSDDNPGVKEPPIPIPVPDTKPSNPDVPLTDSSVINSTLINELVEELANTLDPQPGQSSGIIPIPMLPAKPNIDPDTGLPDGTYSYPSIIPDSGPGFIHVYNPTPAEFVAFGTWLWVTYADATIEKILNNPFDGVIGAHELYATPNRGGRDNIRSAFLTCPTTADLVPNRYSEIDCGTVIVPEFYGNYLDYSPYSQAYIYLPFIGINEVSIDDIVGHAVNIRYRVDSYSGACIAMIFVAKDGYQNLCYQFAGSCSVEVPMAGGSQAAIKAGMMQAEAYARAAMTSAVGHLFGGIGSTLMGSLGGALSGIGGIANDYANAKAGVEAARVANKSSVQHSGQFGASHGAMGQKIPFIIIRNPIQVKVVNYNDDYGYPAHKRVIIGGCTGYLRVREVNVISAHATDDEKAAIEALLKNGVYVS